MTNKVLALRPLISPKRLVTPRSASPALAAASFTRRFSDGNNGSNESNKASEHVRSTEWRKVRLDQLERKFSEKDADTFRLIQSDSELQPEWKSMESRVTNRRTLTKEETGGKTGRSNIRQTEEDIWLESGLYHMNDSVTNDKDK